MDAARRDELAGAYRGDGARSYDRIRPGYPEALLTWLCGTSSQPRDILDLGAGTGLSTAGLVSHARGLVAVDPSAEMLDRLRGALPGVDCRIGTAEEIPLADDAVDLVVVAQAWHWFDPEVSGREIARVLRPGGALGILINQLDVRVPWVHRLSRIMRAGDVYDETFRPPVPPGLGPWDFREEGFIQTLDPSGVAELMRSRSAWRRSSASGRQRMEDNLRWYLDEHLGLAGEIAVPYRSFGLLARDDPAHPGALSSGPAASS